MLSQHHFLLSICGEKSMSPHPEEEETKSGMWQQLAIQCIVYDCDVRINPVRWEKTNISNAILSLVFPLDVLRILIWLFLAKAVVSIHNFFIILVLSSLSIHLLDRIFILTSVLYSVCKTQERRCVLYYLKILSWYLSDAEGNDLKLLVKKLGGILGNSPMGRRVGETQAWGCSVEVQFSSAGQSCPNLVTPWTVLLCFPVHH